MNGRFRLTDEGGIIFVPVYPAAEMTGKRERSTWCCTPVYDNRPGWVLRTECLVWRRNIADTATAGLAPAERSLTGYHVSARSSQRDCFQPASMKQ
jgi:hypothetical protein